MPTTVGPQALTVGTDNNIVDPNQRGGNPSAGVQIQNSSPYQLNVTAAGQSLSIQPFFAQTVEITGAPIDVVPIAVAGQTAVCLVTFSYLLGVAPGNGEQLPSGGWVEPPPQQDGPLTAAAIAAALSTQGSLDNLGTFNANVTANVVAKHTYTALLILTNTQAGHSAYYATVANFTQLGASPIFGGPLASYTTAATSARGVVPCANSTGDLLEVNIVGAGLTAADQVTILGYTTAAPVPLMRADGRAYPLGLFNSGVLTAGAGTLPFITPPAGQRVMLKVVMVTGAAQFMDITSTLNGAACEVIGVPPAGGVFVHEFIGGLLLDVAAPVNFSAGGAQSRANVFYDLCV